jgi:TRIAP1/MDM35 family protein
MDRLVPQCTPLKESYESCFEKWKSRPITVISDESEHICTEIFEDYRACVKLGMLKKGRDKRN